MKAKLIKKIFSGGKYEYTLHHDGEIYIHAKSGVGHGWYKLSKQNCDSLFGVVDIEKLAEESWGDKISSPYYSYIEGFNKAMELNKDKVFTLSNLRKAFNSLENHPHRTFTELVALLQPSEIEVKIEMEWEPKSTYCSVCGSGGKYMEIPCDHENDCQHWQPKLDSEGCLILKKN